MTNEKQLMARRGFLHRAALVIGAVLVGVGRTRPAHALVDCCALCKPASEKCNDCVAKAAWICHHPNYESGPANRRCVECYDAAIDGGCEANGCQHATCSEIHRIGGSSDLSLEGRGLGPLVDSGIGCYDPDTGYYHPWTTPGTPCDDREPAQEADAPTD